MNTFNVTAELRLLAERLKPRDIGFRLDGVADNIEDYINEYMCELPVDAKGRPLQLGDSAIVANDDDARGNNTVGVVSEIIFNTNEYGEPAFYVTIQTDRAHTYAPHKLLKVDPDELEELEDDSAECIVDDLVEMATSDEMYTDVDFARLLRRAIRLQK